MKFTVLKDKQLVQEKECSDDRSGLAFFQYELERIDSMYDDLYYKKILEMKLDETGELVEEVVYSINLRWFFKFLLYLGWQEPEV